MARRGGTNNGRDYYEVLGLAPSASFEELKAAYRDLVKKYHPDLYRTYAQKLWATRKLQEITAAHAVLSNGKQRQAYDQLRSAVPGSQAPRPPERTSWGKWWETHVARPAMMVSLVLWIIISFTLWWVMGGPQHFLQNFWGSLGTLLGAVILGYFLAFMAVFLILIPLAGVGVGIEEAWKSAQVRPAQVKRDLARRLVYLSLLLLVALPILLDIPIRWLQEVSATIGFYALFFIPFMLGELLALIAYVIWARNIVAKTQALAVIE